MHILKAAFVLGALLVGFKVGADIARSKLTGILPGATTAGA